jgi:pimeloyl-ACP methyl ester carboxylesterase
VAEPADLWLERDGVSLHCLEWRPDGSTSQPDLLLLHGLGSSAQYWSRMAGLLPARRLVALDQRGHGLTGRPPHSPALPAGYATEVLLADIEHVIKSLGLKRPVLVGHSWGATISLEFAARNPLALSALVFIDGPVQSAANLFSWEEGQTFMQPPLPRYTSFAQAVDDVRRDFGVAWADDLESFVFSRLMQDGRALILTLTAPIRLELLRGLYESPVDLLWSQLEVPTHVLLARDGPSQVTAWRESGVTKLRRNAPNVNVQWFDTPHDVPIHAPEAVAAELEAVAKAVSETAAREQLQD